MLLEVLNYPINHEWMDSVKHEIQSAFAGVVSEKLEASVFLY